MLLRSTVHRTMRGRASCIPHPIAHVPHPSSCILHPAFRIPHPMWDPTEREVGPLPSGTGVRSLCAGKIRGVLGCLNNRLLCQAQSPVSRAGRRGGAGRSRAPAFVPAPRKTTLSVRMGQHPWGAACLARDTPGCKQAPERASGLSQSPAPFSAAKAGGNLGGKVPPQTASAFVGSWEEKPSKLRRRKGVPNAELQSRKAIPASPKVS